MSSTIKRKRGKLLLLCIYFYKYFECSRVNVLCVYLLQLLGDAEAGVDTLSALRVFRLIVFQEVASGELSSYKSDQRQV